MPARFPRGEWVSKSLPSLATLAIGVVGGVLGTALTPAGEALREAWLPTAASVSGNVVKNGAGIWAEVRLDGSDESAGAGITDVTDDWGGFGFDNVARGPHSIFILEDGNTVSYHREFTVGMGERAKELGDMDLAAAQPRLRPGAAADTSAEPNQGEPPADAFPEETMIAALPAPTATAFPTPATFEADWLPTIEIDETVWVSLAEPTFPAEPAPAETPAAGEDAASAVEIAVASEPVPDRDRQAGLPADARRVSISVAGSPEALSLIDRVTYALSSSFNPNIVTRYDAGDGFRLAFDSAETTVTATIVFRDGTTVEHVVPIVF